MVLTTAPAFGRIADARMTTTNDFHRLAFSAMGTQCRVDFHCSSPARARVFVDHVIEWVARFEARYSRFRPDSLISRINASAGRQRVEIDPETDGLFALCDWYHWQTGGVFDPTSLPLLLLWDYRRPRSDVPSDGEIQQARARVGWRRVEHTPEHVYLPVEGMCIDLGGIGKEYAVDQVMEAARARGLEHVIVDFGRDIRVHGQPPERGAWRIGLEDAADPGRCWAGVAVTNRAVCSSGDYLRYVEINGRRHGHIIDPRSGYPVRNGCHSATVIAPTCTEAGILSTTAMILGPELGIPLIESCQQAAGCIGTEGGRYETRGFAAYRI